MNRGSTPVERVFQHLVQTITVAGIIGASTLLFGLKAKSEVMSARLEYIDKTITELKDTDHSLRIRDLESKVMLLEDKLLKGKIK